MKKKLPFFSIIIFLLFSFVGYSQQLMQSSFFQQNWQTINPAAMDKVFFLKDFSCKTSYILNTNYRQQWLGFEGAPQYLGASVAMAPRKGMLFGVDVYRDEAHAISTTGAQFNFNYSFQLGGRDDVLSIGIKPGLINYKVDAERLRFEDASTTLRTDYFNQMYVDFALGIFYRKGSNFYTGLSIPQIFTLNLDDEATQLLTKQRTPHFYWVAGSFLSVKSSRTSRRSSWILEPSVIVRYVPNTYFQNTLSPYFTGAANIRSYFSFNKCDLFFLWFGGGYETNHNIRTEVGIVSGMASGNQTDKIWQLGLNYLIPAGKFQQNLGMSLELAFSVSW